MSKLVVLQAGIAAFLCLLAYRQYSRRKVGAKLPPGPKPLPIIGNILDLPPSGAPEFEHWLKHKDVYGPLSSLSIMGQTLVIIHDREAARILLEKMSVKTSSRPHMEFGHELCGYKSQLPMQPYNETFRRRRRMLHQHIGTKVAAMQYYNTQEEESRRLLLRTLTAPKNLMQHVNSMMGAIILKTTYGYSIEPEKPDPLIQLIELMISNVASAFVPMAWIVDAIPVMRYLPAGLPGMGFKETARQWSKINQKVNDVPFSFTRQQMHNGSHRPSFVSEAIQKSGDSAGSRDVEDDVRESAATLYVAGAETTSSTLSSFILAMVMFPAVQRKAQEEIDRVVGTDRLPQFEDRDNLPYVEGLVQEAYRWHTVTPMGLPHVAEEDLSYDGNYIPKGAYLLPAVWWFSHDPEVYAEPDIFDPERYRGPRNEPDPRSVAFGFGRRACPGKYYADAAVYIAIAQILATFTLAKTTDGDNREIEVKHEVTGSVASRPKDFAYSILPRSSKHADLISQIEIELPWEKSDAIYLQDYN
ncbi:hypothetical protein NLG97_g1215 [Lecanicillium saksenae]|uniref:Uncharacterized protein n=1 Tax=Lecanicillium saksenae TaxID=468837 RepID=A0ACC1R718_9HYPO|nr:hypothetical protein NLG97_g1215 [Lecanicillium saksenae]